MSEMIKTPQDYDRLMSQKLELIDERRGSLVIRVFWLSLTNEVSLQLFDKSTMTMQEDIIPNDSVMDAVRHPYIYLGKPYES